MRSVGSYQSWLKEVTITTHGVVTGTISYMPNSNHWWVNQELKIIDKNDREGESSLSAQHMTISTSLRSDCWPKIAIGENTLIIARVTNKGTNSGNAGVYAGLKWTLGKSVTASAGIAYHDVPEPDGKVYGVPVGKLMVQFGVVLTY